MRMRDWSSDVCCSDLQAMLAIRAAHEPATVGFVAERLIMKPHSATGLIDRLEASGLVSRHSSAQDRRLSVLELTPRAHALLFSLSATHREEIRSEEHTSELQSLMRKSYAVLCLKKKTNKKTKLTFMQNKISIAL